MEVCIENVNIPPPKTKEKYATSRASACCSRWTQSDDVRVDPANMVYLPALRAWLSKW